MMYFRDTHKFFLFIFVNETVAYQFVNRFHIFDFQTKCCFEFVSFNCQFQSRHFHDFQF